MALPSADLVRASLIADSLQDFVKQAWPLAEQRALKWNWHIEVICEHLEAVSAGEILRLIINIPPRTGKSMNVNVFWPAWEWLRRPETQFMFASYAQRLTTRDSLKCRRIIESVGGRRGHGTLLERAGYTGVQQLIGAEWAMAGDQREKLKFENTEYGYRLATSIGGTGTGEGGDILVVDDPHKADEIESETERGNVIEWLDGTLSTRLNDPTTGRIVLVMQRLHEQDATGHLLEQGGYTHLCLPMEFDPAHPFVWPKDPRTRPGELLWPDHVPRSFVDDLKMRLGSYRSAGQLQQEPAPAEGILFKRGDFRVWRTVENQVGTVTQVRYQVEYGDTVHHIDAGHVTIFQVCDVAGSEKTTADFTVVSTFAAYRIGDWPILIWLDCAARRFDELQVPRFLMDTSDQHGKPPMFIETFGAGSAPFKLLQQAGYPVRELTVDAGTRVDKIARAGHGVALYERHGLFHPLHAEWLAAAEKQLTTFPNAAHDDIVDTVSYAARLLPQIARLASTMRQQTVRRPVTAGVMGQQF